MGLLLDVPTLLDAVVYKGDESSGDEDTKYMNK
jgi:hypothetical protein